MENNTLNYVRSLCEAAKKASSSIASASTQMKNEAILRIAQLLCENAEDIISANAKDIEKANENGVAKTMIDRLSLDERRIHGIADSLRAVVSLADPIGSGSITTRPNGLVISCKKVPLGVVGMIYEARPNVTADAAALCIKTGNAVVLRGGKEAIFTNTAIISLIQRALHECGIDKNAACLIEDTSRDSSVALMNMRGLIDVLIPRGGKGLIKSVVENASVPVIETGAGNCHVYIDESADIDMAIKVTVNAKTSRPSVCNAAESLLVHEAVAAEFLPKFAEATEKFSLEIRGCDKTLAILPSAIVATEQDFYTEYNDYIISVKIVSDVKEAISHINLHNTGHSEAIITRSLENAELFKREVDAAAVYVNASTRFTDGGEFGLGAEIGISTQKMHARGPMGLDALTTVKYTIDGNGQIR